MSDAAEFRDRLGDHPGGLVMAATPAGAVDRILPSIAVVAIAWAVLVVLDATGLASQLHHHALIEGGPPLWAAIPLFLVAWQVMVAAMMVPASVPAIRYATLAAARIRPLAAELAFLAGFLAIWAAVGLGAFVGDMVVHRLVDATPWLAARPYLIEAGVLALAGGWQFVPRKRRDLERCRHPGDHAAMTAATTGGAARFGLRHGIVCIGASWALMLLMFGEGFGSLPWMVALTAVMVFETSLASPRRLSSAVGLGLILLAVWTLSAPRDRLTGPRRYIRLDAIATSANAPINRPEAMFTRRMPVVVSRDRNAPTTVTSTTHQAADPPNTPRVSEAAPAASPPVTPRPTNKAANDKIVIGFVSVRPSVLRYAPASPRRPSVATVAASPGTDRNVRHASHSRNIPPIRPSARRQSTRTSVMAVSPNAAIAPYVPSAVATPIPDTIPTSRPSASVRRMTSRLIGPTAAAMVNPRMTPRTNSVGSMEAPSRT
jgi:predicted metal-binding membrane protein